MGRFASAGIATYTCVSTSLPPRRRMIGQVFLKRYKVLRALDEGGMSKVYLGVQTDSPREVAIKVLKADLAAQPRHREHFRREIFILSRFQHPHAVAYFDADGEA